MRKLFVGAVLALALPVAVAQADDSAVSAKALAKQACKTEKAQMGTKTFKLTYAAKSVAKAKEKCVAKTVPATADAKSNAAQTCATERDADPAAFTLKYGTNGKEGTNGAGKNAFGKCVSATARAKEKKADAKDQEDATEFKNAAKECASERTADADTFKTTYGTEGSNFKNAFGKCVSQKVREDNDEETQQPTS